MIVHEVEGVDRVRVGGQWCHILVHEGRGVGPRRPDGGTVAVHGIAGDAGAGGRPREGDPGGGRAGGLEAGGGGGGLGRRGGKGMKDGAHRVPVAGSGKGGRPVLGAPGARRDVLFVGRSSRCLRPRRVRYAQAASGRHRAGRGAGHHGREHELARTHGRSRTGVDGRPVGNARRGDLVQRAGEGDARVVGDSALQERGRGDGDGDCHPTGRRPAVLAVVEGDVTRVVKKGLRAGRPRPGAVHVVRYLHLLGGVVLTEPPDQQIPLGNRAGECDGERREPRPGGECRPLDEGRGDRLGDRGAWKGNPEYGNDSQASSGQSRRRIFYSHFILFFPNDMREGRGAGTWPGFELTPSGSKRRYRELIRYYPSRPRSIHDARWATPRGPYAVAVQVGATADQRPIAVHSNVEFSAFSRHTLPKISTFGARTSTHAKLKCKDIFSP